MATKNKKAAINAAEKSGSHGCALVEEQLTRTQPVQAGWHGGYKNMVFKGAVCHAESLPVVSIQAQSSSVK